MRDFEVAHYFEIKNYEIVDAHAKLFKDFELLKNGSIKSHDQLKDSYLNEILMLYSHLAFNDDAYATNSIL
jgi:hypothetical protein